jgi:regulator of CtrA degradation
MRQPDTCSHTDSGQLERLQGACDGKVEELGMSDAVANEEVVAVLFGEKLVSSAAFKSLFREGMTLVEETAAYLDGRGRVDSKELVRSGALAYATESMRLTTRLMQLASWLLLQRAVNEGEMTPEQARQEKNKVKLGSSAPEPDERTFELLPERLRQLIRQSLRLQERIRYLDEAVAQRAQMPDADNAVGRQLDRLRQAFGTGS